MTTHNKNDLWYWCLKPYAKNMTLEEMHQIVKEACYAPQDE